MLEEKLKEVIKKFGLEDEKAITFGHPKMKTKWILPFPGITVYSFEQFQPFFIYFDNEGISFFPLDMNNKYSIIGKSFISWNDLKGKYIYVYVTSGDYTYEGSLKHLEENV